MNLTKINIREKNFHNNLISSGNQRSENKYYKALHDLYKDFFEHLEKRERISPSELGLKVPIAALLGSLELH